jgi:hypothetical protein
MITPMIRNAPLCFITNGAHRKVNYPVDHAEAGTRASSGAFPA